MNGIESSPKAEGRGQSDCLRCESDSLLETPLLGSQASFFGRDFLSNRHPPLWCPGSPARPSSSSRHSSSPRSLPTPTARSPSRGGHRREHPPSRPSDFATHQHSHVWHHIVPHTKLHRTRVPATPSEPNKAPLLPTHRNVLLKSRNIYLFLPPLIFTRASSFRWIIRSHNTTSFDTCPCAKNSYAPLGCKKNSPPLRLYILPPNTQKAASCSSGTMVRGLNPLSACVTLQNPHPPVCTSNWTNAHSCAGCRSTCPHRLFSPPLAPMRKIARNQYTLTLSTS